LEEKRDLAFLYKRG
jgi:hypothetical protein